MNESGERSPVRTSPRPGAGAPAGFATTRLIALSMMMGVAMLWLVAWYTRRGGAAPGGAPAGLTPELALLIWGVLAVGTFAAMLVFRGRALAAGEDARRSGDPGARAGEMQSLLIVCFALIEAPALFAGVMYMLTGEAQLLWYAVPVYLVGLALTFPRGEWFGVDPRRA